MGREHSIGRDAERRVAVETAPSSPFVMAKAELLLKILVIALHAPAQLDLIDHVPACGRGRQGGANI